MNDEIIVATIHDIFADALHAKQVESLCHAVVGIAHAAQAGVASVGRAGAAARGVTAKHAIKQFDRFLSNERFSLEVATESLIRFIIGSRTKVLVTLDWTDYPGQHRIALNLVTRHGRATPLLWKTVTPHELTDQRNELEDELLRTFERLMPATVGEVIVLADRGFGDIKRYQMLHGELNFHYVIRFRDCILVEAMSGEARHACDWVPKNGQPLWIPRARVTTQRIEVGAVVAKKSSGMKDNWLLATSLGLPPNEVIELYSRRFSTEENFRDEKDWRFGFGSRHVKIRRPDRRDRLCFVLAVATAILTLLGYAGEQLGLDKHLRANTSKKRTHSFFRQGREYFRSACGNTATALRAAFRQLLADHAASSDQRAFI
jgi:hypothetical protein